MNNDMWRWTDDDKIRCKARSSRFRCDASRYCGLWNAHHEYPIFHVISLGLLTRVMVEILQDQLVRDVVTLVTNNLTHSVETAPSPRRMCLYTQSLYYCSSLYPCCHQDPHVLLHVRRCGVLFVMRVCILCVGLCCVCVCVCRFH